MAFKAAHHVGSRIRENSDQFTRRPNSHEFGYGPFRHQIMNEAVIREFHRLYYERGRQADYGRGWHSQTKYS
jgi:hypothetical protein